MRTVVARLSQLLLLSIVIVTPRIVFGQINGVSGESSCRGTAISCPDSNPPGVEIFSNGVLVVGQIDTVPPNTVVQVIAVTCADEGNPTWTATLDGTDITSQFRPAAPPFNWTPPCYVKTGGYFYDFDNITIPPGLHKLVVTATNEQHLSLSSAAEWYQPKYGVTVQPLATNENVPINDTQSAVHAHQRWWRLRNLCYHSQLFGRRDLVDVRLHRLAVSLALGERNPGSGPSNLYHRYNGARHGHSERDRQPGEPG